MKRLLFLIAFLSAGTLDPGMAHPSTFSTENNTLVVVYDIDYAALIQRCGDLECPQSFCFARADYHSNFGWRAYSAATINRASSVACSSQVAGTFQVVAFVDSLTGLPKSPGNGGVPTMAIPEMSELTIPGASANIVIGSSCAGFAMGTVTVREQEIGVSSFAGDCSSYVENLLPFPIPLEGANYTDSISFRLFAEHGGNQFSKSATTRLGRTFRLTTPAAPAVVLPSYPADFDWRRANDWSRAEHQEPGPLNPSLDGQFCPSWEYTWVQGDSLGAVSPWYEAPGTKLVWDQSWLGSGTGQWARANDTYPTISGTGLIHSATAANWQYVPMLRWTNCDTQSRSLRINGQLKIGWSGSGGIGSPVDVDAVIAAFDGISGVARLLYSTTVSKPDPGNTVGDEVILPIALSDTIGARDAIVVSLRGRNVLSGTRWVYLIDDLTLKLEERTGVGPGNEPPQGSTRLAAHPNPFSDRVRISWRANSAGRVNGAVYDLSGRRIRKLLDRDVPVGVESISWDGKDESGLRVPAGIYFLKLQSPDGVREGKLVLVK